VILILFLILLIGGLLACHGVCCLFDTEPPGPCNRPGCQIEGHQ
jgi:hypothetical protein